MIQFKCYPQYVRKFGKKSAGTKGLEKVSFHFSYKERQCKRMFELLCIAFIDFIFLGFKITVDGDCGHDIKRRLLLGRKGMTKLNGILKSETTKPTKVCLVNNMVFPVVMYGCESWTIKKAEHKRIDAFELWCCSRLLRIP